MPAAALAALALLAATPAPGTWVPGAQAPQAPAAASAQPAPAPSSAQPGRSISEPAATPAPPRLLLTVGPRLAVRNVFFRDRLTPLLSGQKSGALALWSAGLEVFPARPGLPLISEVSLSGSMSRSIYGAGLAAAENVSNLSGRWIAWDAGARLRVVVAGREWGGLSLRYSSERHDFSGPRAPGVVLPSGTLQAWEPGLDVLVPAGPLSLQLFGAWVLPVTRDAIDEVFPRARSQGFTAGARLGYALGEHVEVSLAGRHRRVLHALNPLPYDPYIAGGATDASTLVDLALTIRG